MKKSWLNRFLRYTGVFFSFLLWMIIGLQRMFLAERVANFIDFVPFISVLDMFLIGLLLVPVLGIIIHFAFQNKKFTKQSIMIQVLLFLLIGFVILIYKQFQSIFIHNLSENLIRFYFSPLLPFLALLFYYLKTRLEKV